MVVSTTNMASSPLPNSHGEVIELGDRVAYAGSSCVMRFQAGSVKLWEHYVGPNKGDVGLLGKGEEAMLVVRIARAMECCTNVC